jgi:hypothetical protein
MLVVPMLSSRRPNSATFFPESTLGCYERRDDM